jgi:hypothetical protein
VGTHKKRKKKIREELKERRAQKMAKNIVEGLQSRATLPVCPCGKPAKDVVHFGHVKQRPDPFRWCGCNCVPIGTARVLSEEIEEFNPKQWMVALSEDGIYASHLAGAALNFDPSEKIFSAFLPCFGGAGTAREALSILLESLRDGAEQLELVLSWQERQENTEDGTGSD